MFGIANAIKILCQPLKIFKINVEEIYVLICVTLSIIPALKKNLHETKEACIAKNINLNIRNIKHILTKFLLTLIFRVNEMEDSLIAKRYNNE